MAIKTKGKMTKKPMDGTSKAESKKPVVPSHDFYDNLENDLAGMQGGGGGGGKFWSPKDTVSVIRLVPFEDSNGKPGLFVPDFTHWFEGPGGKRFKETCSGDDCPICELAEDLPMRVWKDQKLSVSKKGLVNAVRRGDKDDESIIAQLTWFTCRRITNDILAGNAAKILHPEKGHDIKIIRGKNAKTGFVEYEPVLIATSCPVGNEGKPVDLTRFIKPADPEKLETIAAGLKKKYAR